SESEKDNVIANTSNLQLSTSKKKKNLNLLGKCETISKKAYKKAMDIMKLHGREKPAKLEAHLANECFKCSNEILRYWKEKLANKTSNYTRKLKNPVLLTSISQTAITTHFISDHPLPKSLIDRLDQKIIKA
ncbi:35367_t:CDS:2, partial [Gigaspora margarita]